MHSNISPKFKTQCTLNRLFLFLLSHFSGFKATKRHSNHSIFIHGCCTTCRNYMYQESFIPRHHLTEISPCFKEFFVQRTSTRFFATYSCWSVPHRNLTRTVVLRQRQFIVSYSGYASSYLLDPETQDHKTDDQNHGPDSYEIRWNCKMKKKKKEKSNNTERMECVRKKANVKQVAIENLKKI